MPSKMNPEDGGVSTGKRSSPLNAGAVVADGLGVDDVEVALVKRMVAVPAASMLMVPSMFTDEECADMLTRTEDRTEDESTRSLDFDQLQVGASHISCQVIKPSSTAIRSLIFTAAVAM